MTTTPPAMPVLPARGRGRFAVIGMALRAMKTLPAPLRERLLDRAASGVSSELPPFPDLLRLVETAKGVPDGRRWQQRLAAHRPDLAAVTTRDISDAAQGRLRIRVYSPPADVPAMGEAFVWVHGGAFLIGSLDQKEAHWPAVELAASGIPVISVDYRPCINGVHYPQPQEDVLTAWNWAIEHSEELGVAHERLHLGGASAGGCLVAGAVQRLRDEGQQLPASLFLGYPVLQGDLPAPSPQVAATLAAVNQVPDEWLTDMFGNWAGNASWDDPYVSPGHADLVGLPPTYVLTCGHDPLRRGSEPFVARLRQAGVPVWQDVLAESEHAPLDRPGTPDGIHALERLRTWLTGGVDAMNVSPAADEV